MDLRKKTENTEKQKNWKTWKNMEQIWKKNKQ